MERLQLDFDPYANEPGHWGASLLNDAELLIACLDAVRPSSVVEVGAYAGDLTTLLLDWAAGAGARVWAIDPSPQKELVALAERREDLELVRADSLQALETIPLPAAAIIDGDHNYFTVSEELRIIARRAEDALLPLAALPRRLLAARAPRRLLRAQRDPGRDAPGVRAGRQPRPR